MVEQMMEEDMSDDNLLKISQKRKNFESGIKNSKVKKTSSQTESTESESDVLLTQLDSQGKYPPESIKAFLEQTKGARLPNVERHHEDESVFISLVRSTPTSCVHSSSSSLPRNITQPLSPLQPEVLLQIQAQGKLLLLLLLPHCTWHSPGGHTQVLQLRCNFVFHA
ncbi:hypothetical protein JOB18_010703 [Solea senegalensis]|uniref:Uncharacterized protein n=1 Tax=Solea senegalensis TaxID=28829 RepID=A0AAV6T5H3_SOLSE|nr:hypothetical protein JOB18_010703 [Solea senegalensis]